VTVFLVGAGPGDPALITRRGLDLVRTADVLVYDRLVHPALIDEAPAGCRLVDAGKRAGSHTLSQAAINQALVEHGRAATCVVRLKGGDPFVFGRGGEEALALRRAGVDFEVVPGVTAGVAAPAYAGIPVTHRGLASLVTFVTGHEDPDKVEASVDWASLARLAGTLVVYMTSTRLAAICARLIEAGADADTPACVIASGTLGQQRVVAAPLRTIAAAAASMAAPALLVVGLVASLRDELAWAERRALHGVTIAITRARERQSRLRGMLEALGAVVIDAAAIRIEPVTGAAIDPARYDVICVTSPAAPRFLVERIGGDARRLAGCLIAAVGPGTQRALADASLIADIVATKTLQEGLADALGEQVAGRRVLIAAAKEARSVLAIALRERGAARVDTVALYRTLPEPARSAQPPACDLIVFTGASTVRSFAASYPGHDLAGTRGVSIGPVTSAEARARSVGVVAEASPHTLDGLVRAVIAAAGNRS
jgi:uroporphyrinogen III methyltransferase / synthase